MPLFVENSKMMLKIAAINNTLSIPKNLSIGVVSRRVKFMPGFAIVLVTLNL
jgi:hypothetical protein